MPHKPQLNYIAHLIIEAFKETGLDAIYIADKEQQLLQHSSKEYSLAWACNYLDSKNTAIFAKKLGVTVEMLQITGQVLAKT